MGKAGAARRDWRLFIPFSGEGTALSFAYFASFCSSPQVHPKFKRADDWSRRVIGAAIEVHREKGPGLLEPIYEKCLMRELSLLGIPARNQWIVPIEYKGHFFEEPLRLDVYIDDCLIVELKAVEKILPIHKAQLLSYLKLLDAPLGLLINFHEVKLVDGLHRLILAGADGSSFGARPYEEASPT